MAIIYVYRFRYFLLLSVSYESGMRPTSISNIVSFKANYTHHHVSVHSFHLNV